MVHTASQSTQTILGRLNAYVRLTRMHKPVGIFLLMWPMLIALWVAGSGHPNPKSVLIFLLGCFLMRSAGCAINDFADRNFDGLVARTKNRPLPQKEIKPIEAIAVFAVMTSLAFALVLCTNTLTISLSFVGALLATCYPFIKRVTHGPQLFLGLAFAWAIPMSYAAIENYVPYQAWILYLATMLWAVVYDTQYALVDIQYDKKIGVKSTAIFFGRSVNQMLLGLSISLSLLIIFYAYQSEVLGPFILLAVLLGFGFTAYQNRLIKGHQPEKCFKAFLNNQWLGALWFVGFFLDLTFQTAFKSIS